MRFGLACIGVVMGLGFTACGKRPAAEVTPPATTAAPVAEADAQPAVAAAADVAVAPTATPDAQEAAAPGTVDAAGPSAIAADTQAAPSANEADSGSTAPPSEADAAGAAAAVDTVTPPSDDQAGLHLPPPGVVTAERLAAMSPVDRPDGAILERAPRCTAHPDGDGCGFIALLGVVGFKDEQLATISTPQIGRCDEADPLVGRVATLTDLTAGTPHALVDPHGDEEPSARQAWAWLARISHDGFKPASDLIKASAEQPSGIRAHTPTVMLGAPLDGWFIDSGDAKDAALFRLVSPDDKTAYPLGQMAFVKAECPKEDRDDGLCADFTYPSVLQVVLTPDRARLVVTTALGDGTHCGTDRVAQFVWPLPKGVTATP